MSSVDSRIWQEMTRALVPDLPYAFNAGGDPKTIPTLTYEQLIDFHETYYHPSRCLFFFYGNFPLKKHLDFIEEHADMLLSQTKDGKAAFDSDVMIDLVTRNVSIKADVIAGDERESGSRADLNFGHTIGHAIEAFVGYENIRHGEAVGLGMVAENQLAVNRGLLAPAAAERVRNVLIKLALPVQQAALDAGQLWRIMQHDKKTRGGKVRIVLARGLGSVDLYDDITEPEVRRALDPLCPQRGTRSCDRP